MQNPFNLFVQKQYHRAPKNLSGRDRIKWLTKAFGSGLTVSKLWNYDLPSRVQACIIEDIDLNAYFNFVREYRLDHHGRANVSYPERDLVPNHIFTELCAMILRTRRNGSQHGVHVRNEIINVGSLA